MIKNDENQNEVTQILLVRVFLAKSEVERRAFMIKDSISIGRDPYTDIYLEDPTVSRLHAVIDRTQEGFVLRDRSSNGTTANGNTIAVQPLRDKDRVSIGRFALVFEFYDDCKSSFFERAQAEGWTMDDEKTLRKSALSG